MIQKQICKSINSTKGFGDVQIGYDSPVARAKADLENGTNVTGVEATVVKSCHLDISQVNQPDEWSCVLACITAIEKFYNGSRKYSYFKKEACDKFYEGKKWKYEGLKNRQSRDLYKSCGYQIENFYYSDYINDNIESYWLTYYSFGKNHYDFSSLIDFVNENCYTVVLVYKVGVNSKGEEMLHSTIIRGISLYSDGAFSVEIMNPGKGLDNNITERIYNMSDIRYIYSVFPQKR